MYLCIYIICIYVETWNLNHEWYFINSNFRLWLQGLPRCRTSLGPTRSLQSHVKELHPWNSETLTYSESSVVFYILHSWNSRSLNLLVYKPWSVFDFFAHRFLCCPRILNCNQLFSGQAMGQCCTVTLCTTEELSEETHTLNMSYPP